MTRRLVASDQTSQFSFGRGMPSDYDFRLTLYPTDSGDPVGIMYDPMMQRTFLVEDSGSNGNYDLQDDVYYRSIKLQDSSGNPVSDPSDASSGSVVAEITRRNGWVYKLEVASTPLASGEFISRLTSIENPRGESITFTYKSFSASAIESSPSRQLQINSVTDSYGNVATFNYHTQQKGGLWVVSEVNLNGGEAVLSYDYNSNGLLSTVSRGSEVTATYSYGIDSQYGFATIAMTNRTNYSSSRNDTLMLSPDYQAGDETVVNQYANILHGTRNGVGQVKHMVYRDPNNVGWFKVQYEMQMFEYKAGESIRWYETWTNNGGGYAGISGTMEPTWRQSTDLTATQITAAQIIAMQPPVTVDETGYSVTNTWDANGNLTRKDHPDSTWEQFAYDSNNLPVYYRDRAGYVQLTERDSAGRILRTVRGMQDVSGSGNATAAAGAVQDVRGYYGADHANAGMLAWTATLPYTSNIPTAAANERTDYQYNSSGRLVKTKLPVPNGQNARPEMVYTWIGNLMTSQTDPLGHTQTYSYDALGRRSSTLFSDGTTSQTLYDDVNSIIYRKNRIGVVSRSTYGPSGRMTSQTSAYGRDADLSDGQIDTVNPVDQTSNTSYSYATGVSTPFHTNRDGVVTTTGLDYQGRQIGTMVQPSSRSTHLTTTAYVNNQRFSVTKKITDHVSGQEYDNVTYFGYSADRQTVRTIETRKPGVSFANNGAILSASRSGGEDPDYVINDAVRDIRGQIVQLVDALGITTQTTYDALGRSLITTRSAGGLSLSSQQSYDEDGNVTQQISEAGVVTQMSYDAAGNLKTRTEAPGTGIEATWAYTYTLDGRQGTMTAPLGGVSTSIYQTCCGLTRGSKDALGHGSVTNANAAGQTVHNATLQDYDSHSNLLNPSNAKTLAESTSRYDDLGRTKYRTRWTVPLGTIDRDNPPIAGIGSVPIANGLTTTTLYDNIVGDDTGLDSSAGATLETLGGGTAQVSIAAAVARLAGTIANGGAALAWTSNAKGRATVSISADQKTMQVSISDAAGRGVFSGQMWGPASQSPNTLINWSCTIHDQYDANTVGIATLKTSAVDIDGQQTHSLTDGYGRSIASIDQLGNVSTSKYDAGGKMLRSINALSHETLYVYDALGRQTSVTDPLNRQRQTTYNPATGRVASQIDARGNSSSQSYDARGRVTAQTDRAGKVTSRSYDLEGRLLTLTDAENRSTVYTYDILGRRKTATLADNSSRAMDYDAAGRLTVTTLPTGKSKTNVYRNGATDIAGVMRKVQYRSTSGGAVTEEDTFSYDNLLRRTGSDSRDSVTSAMVYNDRGQVTRESTTYGGVTYTTAYSYDDRGRRTKVTHPSNRAVEYSYDSRSLLDTIKWNGSQIEDRSYDALGRLTSTDRPSVDESRTYFDNGQVKTIANGAVGTATYAYDANGNKQSESWSGAMSAWNFTTQSAGAAFPGGYDNEDRFMNFVQSGQSKTSLMTRSNIGNISNVSLNGSTTSRSYSNVHELETVGGASQSYDADGNLSASLTGTSFDWDASGMMTTANVNGGPSVEYGYDASGKRIWKKVTDGGTVTETVFIHAGPNCIAEYTKGAPAGSSGNEYIYAGGIDSLVMLSRSGASQNLAITRNQQWSVSALVSAGGSVVERYSYDLFGKRTILAANGSTVRPSSNYAMNYGYTSRSHETETGLMHFRARFYDTNTGEFISRDPLEYVDGMSVYRSYLNLQNLDPSGNTMIVPGDWNDWIDPWVNKGANNSVFKKPVRCVVSWCQGPPKLPCLCSRGVVKRSAWTQVTKTPVNSAVIGRLVCKWTQTLSTSYLCTKECYNDGRKGLTKVTRPPITVSYEKIAVGRTCAATPGPWGPIVGSTKNGSGVIDATQAGGGIVGTGIPGTEGNLFPVTTCKTTPQMIYRPKKNPIRNPNGSTRPVF